jgi:hypothetical protein
MPIENSNRRFLRIVGWLLLSIVFLFEVGLSTSLATLGDCGGADPEIATCIAAKYRPLPVALGVPLLLYGAAVAVGWRRPNKGLVGLAALTGLWVIVIAALVMRSA